MKLRGDPVAVIEDADHQVKASHCQDASGREGVIERLIRKPEDLLTRNNKLGI